METPLFITMSRQIALRRQLTVVANNMANLNTAGFKAQRMLFETYVVKAPGDQAQPDTFDYVHDRATLLDTTEGGLKPTGNRLDVALRRDGYLVVETPEGPRYTRQGRLQVDVDGILVTERGHPVLSPGDEPIVVGADTADIVIARDGTIANDGGPLGRLNVVRFSAPEALRPVGDGLMDSLEPAEPVAQPEIVQGMLESSNVEPIREVTHLIDVQRAYDRARKMVEQENERLNKMIETFTR